MLVNSATTVQMKKYLMMSIHYDKWIPSLIQRLTDFQLPALARIFMIIDK